VTAIDLVSPRARSADCGPLTDQPMRHPSANTRMRQLVVLDRRPTPLRPTGKESCTLAEPATSYSKSIDVSTACSSCRPLVGGAPTRSGTSSKWTCPDQNKTPGRRRRANADRRATKDAFPTDRRAGAAPNLVAAFWGGGGRERVCWFRAGHRAFAAAVATDLRKVCPNQLVC
jgi:hypothetical protein